MKKNVLKKNVKIILIVSLLTLLIVLSAVLINVCKKDNKDTGNSASDTSNIKIALYDSSINNSYDNDSSEKELDEALINDSGPDASDNTLIDPLSDIDDIDNNENVEELENNKDSENSEDSVNNEEAEEIKDIENTVNDTPSGDEYENIPSGTIIDKNTLNSSNIGNYFQIYEISDYIYSKIYGKSYRDNKDIALSDLRYIKVLHYNFNHEIQVGELIVNKKIASDIISAFKELYDYEYEIESMYLIDRYWTGDGETTDTASIDVNNTSSFLYRNATGSSTKLSNHALGMAIDINPQQNPYVSYKSGSPKWYHDNANDYIDRDTGLPHVITHDDICYKIFTKYGFKWGGDWKNIKDYQHFEK